MIALEAGALILGLAVIALIFLLDRPEDEGRVNPGWMSEEWRRRNGYNR